MIDKLNLEAYQYTNLLSEKESPPSQNVMTAIKGIPLVADLGEVSDYSEESWSRFSDEIETKYASVGQKLIGFDRDNLAIFKKFLLRVYEHNEISSVCGFQTLLNHAFQWIIDIYTGNNASIQLINYINNEVEKSTYCYHFFFRIKGLGIENSFKVGNTTFKYFDQDEVEDYYSDMKKVNTKMNFEDFSKLLKDQFVGINAIVQINGEINRATELAMIEAQLSIDVLKCFSYQYAIHPEVMMFELDFRHDTHSVANYLYMINGEISRSIMHHKVMKGVVPIEIRDSFLSKANTLGFRNFSEFIKYKKNDELYLKTVNLIRLFSAAVSSYDPYEKVIKCISLFESISIPEGSTKAKGFSQYKKVILKLLPNKTQHQYFFDIGLNMYKIRDKFMHNNLRWPLDREELLSFMDFIRTFIHTCIQLNSEISTIEKLHHHFNIRPI